MAYDEERSEIEHAKKKESTKNHFDDNAGEPYFAKGIVCF